MVFLILFMRLMLNSFQSPDYWQELKEESVLASTQMPRSEIVKVNHDLSTLS